jgi:hypothetical protein
MAGKAVAVGLLSAAALAGASAPCACPSNGLLSAQLACFNRCVPVNASSCAASARAVQSQLSAFYVFRDFNVNPQALPQRNRFDFAVWDGQVDVVRELDAIASALERAPAGSTVGVLECIGPINQVLLATKDAHLKQTDIFADYGRVLSRGPDLPAIAELAVCTRTNSSGTDTHCSPIVSLLPDYSRSPPALLLQTQEMRLRNASTTITRIDGQPAMEYLVRLARNTALPPPLRFAPGDIVFAGNMGVKPLGNRVNALLAAFNSPDGSARWGVSLLGNSSALPADLVGLESATGEKLLGAWLVRDSPTTFEEGVALAPIFSAQESARARVAFTAVPLRRRASAEPDVSPYSSSCSAERCVFKASAFTGNMDQLCGAWSGLVRQARALGARALLLDVTGNDGGDVLAGYTLLASLFPSKGLQGVWQRYTTVVAGFSEVLLDKRWYGSALFDALETQANAPAAEWDARAALLSANNCSLGRKQVVAIDAFVGGVADLAAASADSDLKFYLAGLNQSQSLFGAFAARCDNGTLSGELVKQLALLLGPNLNALNPLNRLSGFFPNNGTDELLEDLVALPVGAGGKSALYPRRSSTEPASAQVPPLCASAGESPFADIIAVSDGSCGSTCAVVALTGSLMSRADASLPRFRIATFGGTGEEPSKQNLTGTVFQGGSVTREDLISEGALWLAAAMVYSRITGCPLLDGLNTAFPRLSSFAPWNERPIEHPSEAVFSNELGPESLPLEMYIIPTDIYLRSFYVDLDVNGTDLPRLYSDAGAFFNSPTFSPSTTPQTLAPTPSGAGATSVAVVLVTGLLLGMFVV